ncbi:MAG TPA: peptidoglycan recognition protein [Aeromicrobium sp.]|nr:peptidoglycan recognition protein [Aeromicrobium sp.]
MRSRRVIVRLAPYVLTFGLLGSTLAWQSAITTPVDEDLGTPRVVVDQTVVPTVRTDVPVEPGPSGHTHSDAGQSQGGAEAEADGSSSDPSAHAPVVIAELTPREVDSFALVGVTWASGIPATAEVSVRWRGKRGWSDWTELHQENSTPEEGRPGTEPHWVEWADAVAVRVLSPTRSVPNDLRIATIDPGDVRGITPAAVGQPAIILRGAWGARAQRGCSQPIYGSGTRAAVIHHTVGSNSYTKSASASIVRSIQAYHMQANNWCDIGYNFLVDRYGQIFEGRAGGIARQVRAAHSGNATVNELSMGVSLMGTFTNAGPTAEMKAATARLVAWRFALGRVPAKGTVSIGGRTLNRIAGHRDVRSTACPGTYAYSWLGASGGLRDTVARILASGGASTPSITGFRGSVLSSSALGYIWKPVSGAAKYQLAISRQSNFATYKVLNVTSRSARVTGLPSGTRYYAKVRAVRSSGSPLTGFSHAIWMTTRPSTVNVPAGLRISGRTTSRLAFAWSAVSGARYYEIRLSRWMSMASATSRKTTGLGATFTGLSRGESYYAQVRALRSNGSALGAWSGRITAWTPSITGFRGSALSSSSLGFIWQPVAGVSRYQLVLSRYSSFAGYKVYTATSRSLRVTGLRSGTRYFAKVRAVGSSGSPVGGFSQTLSVVTRS